MPLKPGSSKETIGQNISEFHTGKTYAHTAAKFGKAKANRQAIAVALSTARRYGKAEGGPAESRIVFDSSQMNPPKSKTPNMRVTEGHQEYEQGYAPSGRSPWNTDYPYRPILNMRGQELHALKIRNGGEIPRKAGGGYLNMENMVLRNASRNLHSEGFINSSIPGRTDKLSMSVPAGAYVLPADIPSALGQGNSMAGGVILKKMFNSGPYGLPVMKGAGSPKQPRLNLSAPKKPKFQEGGEAEGQDTVPIVAAGAEYVISPEVVRDLGHGNLNAGHKVLDAFVLHTRKEHIKTLEKLPGPKGS